MAGKNPWWRNTTIYQIYPRSFMDSNDDGIGDLQGVIARLDYLKDLGFETIWISPFFTSPQRDWGYDVSDYLSVAPEYGTFPDLEQLIAEVHAREMRVLFDLVLNHTSDQHPWFLDARSSKEAPKRDWYIWRDGKQSRPPNNWRSMIGVPAWHYDLQTEQWYYASFLPFQPDLNYRNPEVVSTMLSIARYWLDLGVDGFRLDIFHSLYKDKYFRDNPWSTKLFSRDYPAGFFQDYRYNFNQPETFQFAHQLRQLADSYTPTRLLLGEVYADKETTKQYLGINLDRLNLVFQWNLINVRPTADYLRKILEYNQANYPHPYTPVLVYGNHDHRRLISRIGNNPRLAKLLAVFQFTARGVPVTYYGEEIGMSELYLPKDNWLDPVGKHFKWLPEFAQRLMKMSATRDGCRSPMQWTPEENAGFSSPGLNTWLPINKDFLRVNVSSERENPASLFNTYRALLRIRNEQLALQSGDLTVILHKMYHPDVLAYTRNFEREKILVLINFGDRTVSFTNETDCTQKLVTIGEIKQDRNNNIELGPFAAAIMKNG